MDGIATKALCILSFSNHCLFFLLFSEKKFGLAFQTAADARAFDKGVCIAIDYLLDGMNYTILLLLTKGLNIMKRKKI